MSANITNLSNPQAVQSHQSAEDAFVAHWRGRTWNRLQPSCSDPRVLQIVFHALGVLLAAAAVTFVILGACCIAGVAPYVLIPVCILGAFLSFKHSRQIKIQQEAKLLESWRKDAQDLPLSAIARQHGWDEIFTRGILTPEEFACGYRQHVASMPIEQACRYYEKMVQRLDDCQNPKYIYYIPKPIEFREKWVKETQDKTFEQILEYPLDQLQKYNILSSEEAKILAELKVFYQAAQNQRDEAIRLLFPGRAAQKQELSRGFQEIQGAYNENPAVMRLQILPAEHNRKRDEITNRYTQQKRQEKDAAYAACHAFLDAHKKLTAQERIEFQALQKQYDEAVAEITTRIQLAENREIHELDQLYREERIQLIGEVDYAKQERAQREADLSKQIEQCDVIDPAIEEQFQNIVKDLNCQFRARR